MTDKALLFKAGPTAYADIKRHGFAADRVGTIAGASGGAKWLVLSQLDRVIVERLVPRLTGPVHLVGSSIGAWRFACYARAAPLAAIERFESAYIEQRYSERPSRQEITDKTRNILDEILGADGVGEIIGHPTFRTHILTTRSRHLTASDRRPLLGTSLMIAATANAVSRRSLGAFFSRSLFHDSRDRPPFYDVRGFPLDRIPLTAANLKDAVVASGSIPLVLNGVCDIAGAPPGTYRDGGIIDYHLDLPLSEPGRLTLFPHFFAWLKPGWFDKHLGWRHLAPANLERTILVCPSAEFIRGLPNAKVPDRTDFATMSRPERMRVWCEVVDRCRRLADELADVLDRDELAARLEPM